MNWLALAKSIVERCTGVTFKDLEDYTLDQLYLHAVASDAIPTVKGEIVRGPASQIESLAGVRIIPASQLLEQMARERELSERADKRKRRAARMAELRKTLEREREHGDTT